MTCPTAIIPLLFAAMVGAQESAPKTQPTPPHGLRMLADPDLPRTGSGGWTAHGITPSGAPSERTFLAYRPKTYAEGNPCVLLLHGGGGSARTLFGDRGAGSRHWPVVADREGFMLVVPDGTPIRRGGDRRRWNDVRPVGSKADDVGFLDAVLDCAIQVGHVDPGGIYITGSSNGGMMTFRMVMERSERFAAAAAFIASFPAEGGTIRTPEQPLPLLMVNGTEDPLIRWGGGRILAREGLTIPVERCVAWWAATNGCGAEPEVEGLPDLDPADACTIERHTYPTGDEGTPFEFLKVLGGGHAMPSSRHRLKNNLITRNLIGPVCRDLEGAEYAWRWMRGFRRAKADGEAPR